MVFSENVKSIRRELFVLIFGVALLCYTLFAVFVSNLIISQSNEQAINNAKHWVSYINNISASYLTSPDKNKKFELHKRLSQLEATNIFKLIHLYQYDKEKNTESAYLSYKHQKSYQPDFTLPFSAISPQLKSQESNSAFITENSIEYFSKITLANETVGYAYLVLKNNLALTQKNNLIIAIISHFLFTSFLCWLIVNKLERKISSPLQKISNDIQGVTRSKDFSTRLEVMPYREADLLAKNINTLLSRVEKHIEKLNQAEQFSIKRNDELQEKIVSRTAALKESNQELLSTLEKLHQYQDQLVESGKMASLGDMVAGIAHEVNTPIGLGVTASTLLSDRLNEMKQHFDDKTLKSSQLNKFFNEGQENVGIIYRNLKRAAELISSFKKVAVDQTSEDVRQFNMSELIDEVLLTLAPQIKNTPYQININCQNDMVVWSKPGPINQVLINLILNSIIHGFEDREHGNINISVTYNHNEIYIDYQDDGKGIDQSIRDKIFEPFTTTKRGSGGSGLGLHLVYNLVTQALGGNINIESELGKGTEFKILFPLDSESASV